MRTPFSDSGRDRQRRHGRPTPKASTSGRLEASAGSFATSGLLTLRTYCQPAPGRPWSAWAGRGTVETGYAAENTRPELRSDVIASARRRIDDEVVRWSPPSRSVHRLGGRLGSAGTGHRRRTMKSWLADLIEQSPCILDERQLGPLVDKHPEWRNDAVFARDEVETIRRKIAWTTGAVRPDLCTHRARWWPACQRRPASVR
jgi:hypothetical protein